jgi:hypothetical protein
MATAKAVTCNGGKYFGIIEVGTTLYYVQGDDGSSSALARFDCLTKAKEAALCYLQRAVTASQAAKGYRIYIIDGETHQVAATTGTEKVVVSWKDN